MSEDITVGSVGGWWMVAEERVAEERVAEERVAGVRARQEKTIKLRTGPPAPLNR